MPIGNPLSPTSVAGMRRRDDRRDDRGPGDNNNGPGDKNRSPVKTAAVAATIGPGAAVISHRR